MAAGYGFTGLTQKGVPVDALEFAGFDQRSHARCGVVSPVVDDLSLLEEYDPQHHQLLANCIGRLLFRFDATAMLHHC